MRSTKYQLPLHINLTSFNKLILFFMVGVFSFTTVFSYALERNDNQAALSSGISAYRSPEESYETARSRALNLSDIRRPRSFIALPGTVETESFLADQAGMARLNNSVATWEANYPIGLAFNSALDHYLRWYDFESDSLYSRRISWRYPYDGCYLRATLFNERMKQKKLPILQRIFVFGQLSTYTNNAPEGKVSWWYHVAPVTKINNEILVMDPAIDNRSPMSINQWLGAVVNARPDPQKASTNLKIAVCDANAFTPTSPCNGGTAVPARRLHQKAQSFLEEEWMNMLDLKLNPHSELLS